MRAIFTGDSKAKKEAYLIAGILFLFFGVLFSFGPGAYPDTQGYIDMDIAREPLYPLFLLFCRVLAGEKSLWFAILLQNVFCGVNVYLLYFYIKGMCFPGTAVTQGKTGGKLLSTLLLGSLLLPHLVTPLLSSSHMILSNSIISEGLCYPLYQFFIYQLLKVLWEDEKRIVPAFVLALLLELTRGQMMTTVLVWMLVSGYRIWINGKRKLLAAIAAGVVLLFGCRGPLICGYNLLVHGVYAQNTSNNLTILTNLLYASDRENGASIEDPVLQELFYRMYDGMEEREYTYHFAGSSMQEQAVHQEYTHDYIKFDVVTPVLKEYVRSLPEKERDGTGEGVLIDRLAGSYTKTLILQNPGVRLKVYAAVVWCGLVRTAAFLRPGINFLTMLVYLVLAVLGFLRLKKNPRDRAGLFLLFAYLIVCANVFSTGLMIMCLSRYVVYNTSFLYMAALLVLWKTGREWTEARMEKRKGESKNGL